MKWINAATLLIIVVLLCVISMLYSQVTSINNRIEDVPSNSDVNDRFKNIEEDLIRFRGDVTKEIANIYSRLEDIESGATDLQPQGETTPDFLLADLERQICLKNDAVMSPDRELAAKKRINEITAELSKMNLEGKDITTPLTDRIQVSRDPDVQIALLRDISWQFGPSIAPSLMELFRDKDFPHNLRVLAAHSALKAGGNEKELLEEFTNTLDDKEDVLTVKTGLVRYIFKEYRYEKAVDHLINGARNSGYATQHRIDCLMALQIYDDSRVIRAFEEIIYNDKDDPYVINLSIQAYHQLLQKECVPFLQKILDENKIESKARAKIITILKDYEDSKEGG